MVPPLAPSFKPASHRRNMGSAGMNPAPPTDGYAGSDAGGVE
jgi:hypothetical protein